MLIFLYIFVYERYINIIFLKNGIYFLIIINMFFILLKIYVIWFLDYLRFLLYRVVFFYFYESYFIF